MNIQDNIYRYTNINSSINVLWNFVASFGVTFEEIKEASSCTYMYINSLNELKGIIGIIPKSIEDEDIKNIIPKLRYYPKGNDIYFIKYIYAEQDEVDHFSSYHILNQLIKQSTITMGDRPILFVSQIEDKDLINALKNNRFTHNKFNDYNIFIQYPKEIIDNETPKKLYESIEEIK